MRKSKRRPKGRKITERNNRADKPVSRNALSADTDPQPPPICRYCTADTLDDGLSESIGQWRITPQPYTRMLNRGKRSPQAKRYQAYQQECRLRGVWQPASGDICVFVMPMPDSWSPKRRNNHWSRPHETTPDVDNLVKGLLDAVYDDDRLVWCIEAYKYWGNIGRIIIVRNQPRFSSLIDIGAMSFRAK